MFSNLYQMHKVKMAALETKYHEVIFSIRNKVPRNQNFKTDTPGSVLPE
jgi:hypothetical protein